MSLGTESAPLCFRQLHVGAVFTVSARFGFAEMDQFAALSGDHSAIHTDSETARLLGFPDRVQYGFLLTSLLSRIVGENFHHAVCAAVSIDFVRPAIAGQDVSVRAEVAQLQDAMRSAVLRVTMVAADSVVARGKLTVVFLPEQPAAGPRV